MAERVLIVEDSPTAARTLAAELSSHQLDVTVATSGAEALALVPRVLPDLILLDLYLPDMSGELVFR